MADYDTTKWAPVDAPAASGYDKTKWAAVGASLAKKPASMSQAPGLGARAMDESERLLGYGAGAGFGIEGGPVGAALGAGVGATTADIDIAKRHQAKYGTPIDLSPGNVAKDAALNVGGGYVGEKAAGLAGTIIRGGVRMMRGEPELEAGAREAYTKAGEVSEEASAKQAAANLEARTNAYQAAQAKAEKAAQGQAAANLTEQQKAAEKAAKASRDFHSKRTDIERETSDQLAKLRQDIAEKLTPEGQQAAIQGSTGRTPEATARATMQSPEAGSALPGAGQVERQQRFYRDITSPLKRASDAWAAKRDALMGDFMDEHVDSAPLMGAINEEQQYAQQNAKSFSPAIQKLFNTAQNVGAPDPLEGYVAPEELAQMSPIQRKNYEQAIAVLNKGKERTAGVKTVVQRAASAFPAAEPAPQPTGPSVRALLGVRSEASRLADAATSATDRHAASSIADAVDETLTQINAPSLAKLNGQYRLFKTQFPRQFGRAISAAAEPVDTATEIFDKPYRAMGILNGAQPEERQTLRKLYADWVNRDGAKVIKPEHAPVLAKLFPRTPLGTPEGFTRITSKELGVEELLKTSPEVQQRFMQAYIPAMRAQVLTGMQDTTRAAITQARKMGPLGQQIVARIQAATDPVQQFKVAIEAMTGATPDQIMQGVTSQQVKPEAAALAANAGQTPMQVMRGVSQPSPEAAGREAIIGMGLPGTPTTPQQAAIGTIQAGGTGKTSGINYYLERAKHLFPIYAAIGGPALASGHVSYSGVMALIGGSMAVSEFAKRGFYKSLESPEAAANYWRALNDLSSPSSLNIIARQAANATMSDLAGNVGKAATGVTLEKEPDNKPTDMTREYDRKTAEKVVGANNPERVEHAIKVNKDLRKGKTPDVAGGLRTGRLSMPAVKRLLKMQSAKTAPALVQHLGPDDLKHMLALATPEEEAWLRPLVEKRLGNG